MQEVMSTAEACSYLCQPAEIRLVDRPCATLCGGAGGFYPIGVPTAGRQSNSDVQGKIGLPNYCGHCTWTRDPVCGFDDQTHYSECYAACDGVVSKYKGECTEDKESEFWRDMLDESQWQTYYGCTSDEKIVCGSDRKYYTNTCMANRKGVEIVNSLLCSSWINFAYGRNVCSCPMTYWPVCGVDGEEYSNMCFLECAGVSLAWPVLQSDGTRWECDTIY